MRLDLKKYFLRLWLLVFYACFPTLRYVQSLRFESKPSWVFIEATLSVPTTQKPENEVFVISNDDINPSKNFFLAFCRFYWRLNFVVKEKRNKVGEFYPEQTDYSGGLFFQDLMR